MASTKKKSDLPVIIAAVVGVAFYAVATTVVVKIAGGDKIEPSYSNTPNGVTSTAPDFK